tara:strand:+ start:566 stop:802 length:237 start_codon:yes stop_codon:yes gene_type:complete
MSGYFNILKQGAKTKTGQKIITKVFDAAKKIKGSMETNPNVRQGIAQALKDMKKKKFIGIKSKKIPHDLSHLKGTLKD